MGCAGRRAVRVPCGRRPRAPGIRGPAASADPGPRARPCFLITREVIRAVSELPEGKGRQGPAAGARGGAWARSAGCLKDRGAARPRFRSAGAGAMRPGGGFVHPRVKTGGTRETASRQPETGCSARKRGRQVGSGSLGGDADFPGFLGLQKSLGSALAPIQTPLAGGSSSLAKSAVRWQCRGAGDPTGRIHGV